MIGRCAQLLQVTDKITVDVCIVSLLLLVLISGSTTTILFFLELRPYMGIS